MRVCVWGGGGGGPHRQAEVVVGAKVEQRPRLAVDQDADGLFGRDDALALERSRVANRLQFAVQNGPRRRQRRVGPPVGRRRRRPAVNRKKKALQTRYSQRENSFSDLVRPCF